MLMKYQLSLKEIEFHGNQFQKVRLLYHITGIGDLHTPFPVLLKAISMTHAKTDAKLHSGQEKSFLDLKQFSPCHHHQLMRDILQL